MKAKYRMIFLPVLCLALVLAPVKLASCTSTESTAVPPFLPPHYYDCIKADPTELAEAYFSSFLIWQIMGEKYDGKVIVFKDVLVEERMYMFLDEGYIWVDQIKCYLVDIDNIKRFQPGDRVDVVGVNKGPTQYNIAILKFDNVVVLPAGSVALPSDPDAGSITPGY